MIRTSTVKRNVLDAFLPSYSTLAKTMGQPQRMRNSVPLKLAKSVGLTISIAILIAVVWTTVARVNELSVASGSLIPAGFEQTVQHLEGGIVQSLRVREGDVVEAGTPLIELRDASTLEDSETMDRQRVDLQAQLAAQRSLADGTEPDFGFIPAEFSAELTNNRNAYEAENATLQSQRREIDSQVSQARYSLDVANTQHSAAAVDVENATQERDRFAGLLSKGVATKVQAAERERMLVRANADLEMAASRQRAASEKLAEVEQQLASFVAKSRSATRQRILELEGALTALEGNIRKKDGRKQRLEITAPIAGIVKSLTVRGAGEVVGPGQQLAVIVPLSGPLIAQTRVPASQIGYLKVGQEAHVKLTAYDFTRFGWLPAKIDAISPSAFQNDGQASYYMVKLGLQEHSLKRAPEAPILPGMELTADIITGQKTVLQYLLTPLQRTFSSAFGER